MLAATVDSNFVALCIFRALQGAAAACTVPTAYAMVGVGYKGQARELAVAALGVSSTTGAIIGSIGMYVPNNQYGEVVPEASINNLIVLDADQSRQVGGAFASTGLGYRGPMWLSFGISAVLCVLAFLLLEPTPRDPSIEKKPLDVIGAFLVTAGCAIVVYGFTEAPTGWSHAKVIAPIIIGVALLVLFFVYEQFIVWRLLPRVDPLIPTRVWTYSNLVPLTIQTGLLYGCFFLSVLNGSTFLLRVQEVRSFLCHPYSFEAQVDIEIEETIDLSSNVEPTHYRNTDLLHPDGTILQPSLHASEVAPCYWTDHNCSRRGLVLTERR